MSDLNFPAFTSHKKAKQCGCCNCQQPLSGTPIDDGYQVTRGKYCLSCEFCGFSTWYDIKEKGEGLTPQRAKEIYDAGSLWHNWRKMCSTEEDVEIRSLWANMPGNTCWLDALIRFAQNKV